MTNSIHMSMANNFKSIHLSAQRPLLIILLVFSITGNAFSQNTFQEAIKNYQDGVIILNSGDTLHGQIDNREWLVTPFEIELVREEQKKTFTALDIKELRIADQTYRSAKVDLDISPLSLRHLTTSPTPVIAKDTTVILLLLAQGEVNLFYLMDAANKKHFFFQQSGQVIKELVYYKYYASPRKGQTVTRHSYRNQLRAFSATCKKELYYEISYNMNEMMDFFYKLNSCLTGDAPAVEKISRNRAQVEVGVFAGAHHANYLFTENIFGNGNEETYSQVIPSLGINANYIFANSLEQFALSLSAQYQHKKIEHSYRLGKSWLISDNFNSSNILMAANFRYAIPFIGQIRPYISGGPVLKYFIDPRMAFKKEVFDYEGDLITGTEFEFGLSAFVPGMSVALGAAYQRFNFEARYYRQSANELSERKGSIRTNSLSLLVYYNIVY